MTFNIRGIFFIFCSFRDELLWRVFIFLRLPNETRKKTFAEHEHEHSLYRCMPIAYFASSLIHCEWFKINQVMHHRTMEWYFTYLKWQGNCIKFFFSTFANAVTYYCVSLMQSVQRVPYGFRISFVIFCLMWIVHFFVIYGIIINV